MKTKYTHNIRLLMTALLSCFFLSGFAQEDDSDTTRVHFGKNVFEIIRHSDGTVDTVDVTNHHDHDHDHDDDHDSKGDLSYWSGFDLGVSGYLNANNQIDLGPGMELWEIDYAKSINFNLNIMDLKARLIKDYVGLVSGVRFEWNQYAFKNDVLLDVTSEQTSIMEDTVFSYSKNKLKATYLSVPAMIEFNTSLKRSKSFHITAGVLGGWRIGSKWKFRYETDEEEIKSKVKSHYHLNPFKFTAEARVGFGGFTLYGNYALNSLFENGKGPQLYPFNVGFAFTGF